MTSGRYDVAVVGLGAMGAMTAWQLAARGASVVGLERFAPGHDRGSSHGGSRIFRMILFEGPEYVPIARASLELYRRLERETRTELLVPSGGVVVGPEDGRLVADALASAAAGEVEHEVLGHDELAARFPQHALRDGDVAVYEPGAGVLRPEAAIVAAAGLARTAGAELRTGTTVDAVHPEDGGVRIETGGETLHAARAVVATGAWFGDSVPYLDLPVRVQRSCLNWFHGADRAAYGPDRFPTFVRQSGDLDGWGIPDVDGRGVKIGVGGSVPKRWLDRPEDNWTPPTPEDLAPVERFCRAAFPGLDPRPADAYACMNAKTPDGDFVLGIPAAAPSLVLLGGFSGHGFKHAAGVGRIAADLALDGACDVPLDRFSPDRFAGAPAAGEGGWHGSWLASTAPGEAQEGGTR